MIKNIIDLFGDLFILVQCILIGGSTLTFLAWCVLYIHLEVSNDRAGLLKFNFDFFLNYRKAVQPKQEKLKSIANMLLYVSRILFVLMIVSIALTIMFRN